MLNYAQCRLLDKDYYAVIEHCSEVLKHEPSKKIKTFFFFEFGVHQTLSFSFKLENVKALYRRAKAHAAVWNTDNAKEDFQKCAILDASLTASVNKELKLLADAIRQKDSEDKIKYQNIF